MTLKLLTPDAIRQIGEALGGTHWQADVARYCDISPSSISRILDKTRGPNTALGSDLQNMMIEKIASVAELLDLDGLPHADTAEIEKAKELIADAVKILREPKGKTDTTSKQRFEVIYPALYGTTEKRSFEMKGPAFAFGKRQARKNMGLRVEITRITVVQENDVRKDKDQKAGSLWWRADKRWDFYPDGTVDSRVLTE